MSEGSGIAPFAGAPPASLPKPLRLQPWMLPLRVRAWISDAAPVPIGTAPTSGTCVLHAEGTSTRRRRLSSEPPGGARSSLVPPQPGIPQSWPAVRATAAGAASAWAPCTVTELLFPLPHSFLPFFQLLHFFLVVPVASFGGPSLFFSGRPPLLYLFLLLKLPPPLLLFVLLRVFFTLRGRGGWCFRRRVPPAFAAAAAFAASTSSRVGQSLSDSSSFSEEELRVLVGSGIPTSVHGPDRCRVNDRAQRGFGFGRVFFRGSP